MSPQAVYDWLPAMCEQYRRDGVVIVLVMVPMMCTDLYRMDGPH